MFDHLTDAALVQRCRDGHQAAWSTLVRRYQRLVFTVPRRAGLSEALAEDVLQLTFSRLFERLDQLTDAERVRAWLVTTARRETLDVLAAQRRSEAHRVVTSGGDDDEAALENRVEQVPDPAPWPDQALAELQELERVRQAVDRLEPRQRQLVELLFLTPDPPPYAEIARRLGISEGSIGPTRARCIERLRGLLAGGAPP